MQKRILLSFISSLILLISTMTIQAGFVAVDFVEASSDCDTVSGSWSHGSGEASTIYIFTEGGSLLEVRNILTNSGTFDIDLTPDLANNTTIEVRVDIASAPVSIPTKHTYYKDMPILEGFTFARTIILVTCIEEMTSGASGVGEVEPETVPILSLCEDGRLTNTLCDPLVVYNVVSDDGIGIVIYTSERGGINVAEFQLYIPAETFDALENSSQNCTIASSDDGSVVVYLLASGEYQIDTGPDEEGKVFSYIFTDLISSPTSINTYFSSNTLEILPFC